jgi:hypothetical protein
MPETGTIGTIVTLPTREAFFGGRSAVKDPGHGELPGLQIRFVGIADGSGP